MNVSIATPLKEGLVVGMRKMLGNLFDGHALAKTIERVTILAKCAPTTIIVDKGHRGVDVKGLRILRPGQRRGITRSLKTLIKRCSAIEPTIGRMKMDDRLGHNPMKRGTR